MGRTGIRRTEVARHDWRVRSAAVILGVTEAAASAALRHGSGALGFDGPDRIWPAMGFGRLQ